MKLGFIGFGEAASEIACGLRADGLQEIYAYDIMQNDQRFASKIRDNAERTGAVLVNDYQQLADTVEMIFAIVPPNCAADAASAVKPYLRPGMLYADLSSSTPDGEKTIAAILDGSGVEFADGAIMGAPINYQNRVPILACGSGAQRMQDEMNAYGMHIRAIGETIGAASAIKLIRSIYMKGTAALGMEMLQAAGYYGVADEVVESIRETMDSKTFLQTLNRLTTSTTIHAERRVHELEGSIQMLEEAHLDSTMVKAAHDKHVFVADKHYRERLGAVPPADWREVIRLLNE